MSSHVQAKAPLSAEEKRALLARLLREKAAAAAPPRDLPVHRLIEAQAARTPGAVAVAFEGTALTYAELNARANRLAHHLRTLGVGPEVLVGLCVERSAEMLVGLLGILKAGGAYVPLDPSFPEARLAYMLEDARAAVLVTERSLAERFPAAGAHVLLDEFFPPLPPGEGRGEGLRGTNGVEGSAAGVGTGPSGARGGPHPNPLPGGEGTGNSENPRGGAGAGAAAGNLAYVIYTSGSTGRPKGVQVTHGALTNFLQSMRQLLDVTEKDALLAVTTLSFDIAGLEMFLPLIAGARVEVVGRDVAADGARLAARLADSGATILQATPASWRLLLEAGWPGSPGLTMGCGGEALPRALADRLLDKGKALWNLYGPTETTIWSSLAKVEPGEGAVSIGRPIANTQLYVLDSRLRPAPLGVAGELYIGGAGLARGYLRRPGLTAQMFVPDPFGEPGARLYRTGDLARWRPDGGLECLGRIDHQVKIRGYRIELGEIEAVLAKQPAVKEAVVVAREDTPGDPRLVAYIVTPDGQPAPAADLRRALAAALPEYMVPAAFATLAALPLTPNGKVDRNALPAPEPERTEGSVAPRNPVEEALAGIWGDVLGVDRVGIHDGFFELGGHSLLAAQVLARLRDAFGVELPLAELFDAPTVAAQARMVEQALRAGAGLAVPPIPPADRSVPIPASLAQQRLWLAEQIDPGNASYNVPCIVRMTGTLDEPALERALNEVVRRHEALRTTLVEVGGEPRQIIAEPFAVPIARADLSTFPDADREAEVLRRVRAEAMRPFDLARGPLIRAAILRLAEAEHVAVVMMHHVVSDGWSIGVLIREVGALYEAFAAGKPSPLPELPIQYADYAAWERSWLSGEVLDKHLAYWKDALAGLAPLALPTDRPRALGRGGRRAIDLPAEVAAGLKALGRREGATSFMTYLAGLQALLHRYTNQEDIAVGTPVAGRVRSELEGLIGDFVNTLILRADLAGDPSFRELIRRARKAALGAFAHQDLPFEKLVAAVGQGREGGRTPLFRVMFAPQQDVLPGELGLPGLTITPLEVDNETAKFDLTLVLADVDGTLRAIMEYDAGLFDVATIDRMLGHFRTLLEGAVAEPDQPIGLLPMLSEAERLRMLDHGGAGAADADAAGLPDLDALSEEELDALLGNLSADEDATHE